MSVDERLTWGLLRLGDSAPLRKLMILSGVILAIAAAAAAALPASLPQVEMGIHPVTRPSKDVTLAVVRSGLITSIPVKEGDTVKAGQVIIQLDDAAERSEAEQYKEEAENKTSVQAAEAELKQSRVDLKKMEQANAHGAATDLELQHAQLEVVIKELTLELARFKQAQARRKYEETQIIVDRMKLRSPIDGQVEIIVVHEGEAAEQLAKIVRVVQIDPLWIDVPAPLAMARSNLKAGQVARVTFENSDGTVQQVDGRIDRINVVADSASETLNVRVEVPNPTRRPAGEHVTVTFPATQETDEAPAASQPASQPSTQPQ